MDWHQTFLKRAYPKDGHAHAITPTLYLHPVPESPEPSIGACSCSPTVVSASLRLQKDMSTASRSATEFTCFLAQLCHGSAATPNPLEQSHCSPHTCRPRRPWDIRNDALAVRGALGKLEASISGSVALLQPRSAGAASDEWELLCWMPTTLAISAASRVWFAARTMNFKHCPPVPLQRTSVLGGPCHAHAGLDTFTRCQ